MLCWSRFNKVHVRVKLWKNSDLLNKQDIFHQIFQHCLPFKSIYFFFNLPNRSWPLSTQNKRLHKCIHCDNSLTLRNSRSSKQSLRLENKNNLMDDRQIQQKQWSSSFWNGFTRCILLLLISPFFRLCERCKSNLRLGNKNNLMGAKSGENSGRWNRIQVSGIGSLFAFFFFWFHCFFAYVNDTNLIHDCEYTHYISHNRVCKRCVPWNWIYIFSQICNMIISYII